MDSSSTDDGGRHVSGSTAGAGSGDFHQYRNARRIEQDRLSAMEKEIEDEEIVKEYEDRIRIKKAQEVLIASKKKNKRLKRKMNRKQRAAKKQKTDNNEDKGKGEKAVPNTEKSTEIKSSTSNLKLVDDD